MEYQAFLKAVTEFVTAVLPRDYFITVYPVRKNNNYIWDAFVVKGGEFSPAVYVLPYYEQYKNGVSLSKIQIEIAKIFQEVCVHPKEQMNTLLHYHYVRSKIVYRLVNYKSNDKWLKGVPHRLFLDMAIVYYIVIDHPNNEWSSTLVTNQIQQIWKKTESELYQIAKRNTPEIFPPVVNRLSALMKQLQKLDQETAFSLTDYVKGKQSEDREMYIISNQANFYGAACICYSNIWDELASQENTDLAVTTLSVHELIAVPFQKYDTWELFRETAKRTYDTIPIPTERLTASVYRFSKRTGKFSLI